MTRTGAEVQVDNLAINTVKQFLDVLCTHQILGNTEAKRVDTLVQDVKCLLVGLNRIIHCDVLTNIPCIGVLLITTHERELSRESIRGLQILQIFTTVEGLHIKTFIGSPYQTFLEIGPLEVNLNLVKPLLGGRCLKLGKEFFFVCHKNTFNNYISLF